MDIASKIKLLKEQAMQLNEEKSCLTAQNKELLLLVEENKKREAEIAALKNEQASLLAKL